MEVTIFPPPPPQLYSKGPNTQKEHSIELVLKIHPDCLQVELKNPCRDFHGVIASVFVKMLAKTRTVGHITLLLSMS